MGEGSCESWRRSWVGGPPRDKSRGRESRAPQAGDHEVGHCLISAVAPAVCGLVRGEPQLGGYCRGSRGQGSWGGGDGGAWGWAQLSGPEQGHSGGKLKASGRVVSIGGGGGGRVKVACRQVPGWVGGGLVI